VTVITEVASGPQANSVAEDMVKVSDKRVAIDSGLVRSTVKVKLSYYRYTDKDLESKQYYYFYHFSIAKKVFQFFFII
jgi:hypothetical protein